MLTRSTEAPIEAAHPPSISSGVSSRLEALRARLAGRRSPLWILLLYAILAGWVMHPFFPKAFRSGGDLFVVLGTITEAEHALREGQFPLRVAPTQQDGTRYPFFQFYGQFPYALTAAADFVLPGNLYTAWRWTAGLMLVVGAFYTQRLAYRLTRRTLPSVAAGAAFMTAPYMFADVAARGAYTEFVAVNLMPAVFFYTWRAFVSPRRRYVVCSAIAWALLGLSHNVSFLYGVIFAGLFFLSLVRLNAKYLRRLARTAVAGVLALAMVAFYVAPQLLVLKSLVVHDWPNSPMNWTYLTVLRALLSPTAYTDPTSTTPDLTLQVGLPLMAGVLLAAVSLAVRRRRRGRRGMVVRLLALFALAFFVVWSPVNFWQYLPKLLAMVQFPYRVLMFVMLFGALLTAYGLRGLRREGEAPAEPGASSSPRPGGSLALPRGAWPALAFLALVGFATVSYFPPVIAYDRAAVRAQTEHPVIGGLDDYLLTTEATAATSYYHPDANLADWEFGLTRDGKPPYSLPSSRWLLRLPWAMTLPAPRGATALVIEGELPARGFEGESHGGAGERVVFTAEVGAKRTSTELRPGPFRVVAPLERPSDGTPVRVNLEAMAEDPARGRYNTAVRLNRVAFDPPGAAERPLVVADSIKDKIRYGRRSKLRIDFDRPSLVQLPVLYYPKLMSVRVDGRPVPYGNLGRFVALPLGPGRHAVEVTFTGLPWANVLSLVGWVVALGGLAALAFRRSRRGAMTFAPVRRRPAFGWREFAVSIAVLVLGVAVGEAAPRVARWFDRGLRLDVSADSAFDDGQAVALAFDGNPATFWAARGSNPATLTIRASHPAKLVKIELDARQTSLLEAWKRVRVTMYRGGGGAQVFQKDFEFPNADREPVETIALPPTDADRIELRFSDPVTVTRDGRTVPVGAVSPGYREIRLTWEGEQPVKR